MEEEGKGRHLLHLKHQCFRHFKSFGRDTGRGKKGRGFYHKDGSRQQAFLFSDMPRMLEFSVLLGDWRG